MYIRKRNPTSINKRLITTIESQMKALVSGSYRIGRDGISQSLMSNWTCRVKFCLACQRWTTPDKGKTTYYGTMCHDICEAIYKGGKMLSSREIDFVINKFIRKNKEKLLIWTDGNIEFSAATVKTVMGKYCDIYESDFKLMNIVEVENKFCTRMEQRGLDLPYIIRGKIDMLFSYKKSPEVLFLMEHKSMGTVNEKVLKSRLPIDKQNLFYLTDLSLEGKSVNSILYNIIRRPQIKMGGEESIVDFCTRLGADINSRPDFYFMRYPIYYTPEDLTRYEEQLYLKFNEIDLFTKGELPLYRNESSCESAYNGTPFLCEYIDVCQSNDLRGFIQQNSLFPELED